MSRYEIELDYDRRIKVWRNIILHNRHLHLQAAPDVETLRSLHGRYVSLDQLDAARLARRAWKEFNEWLSPEVSDHSKIMAYNIYLERLYTIDFLSEKQIRRYNRILGMIRPHDIVIEHIEAFKLLGGS